MRNSRSILLLVLAACLALAGLAAPFVWKGLAQRRIEQTVERSHGLVSYDPDVEDEEGIRWLFAYAFGPQFTGNIVVVSLLANADPRVTDEALQSLGELPDLYYLLVHGSGVDASCLEKIADLKSLGTINIHMGTLRDLSPLARSTSITSISLQHAKGVTPELIAHLGRIPNLEYLSLFGCDVAGSSLVGFRDFVHLERLDLSSISITTDDLAALADAPALRTVVIDDTISGTQSLEEIKTKLPRITIEQAHR